MSADDITPEFSRPIALDRLSAHWAHFPIAAQPAELAALATRMSLIDVAGLSADVALRTVYAGAFVELQGTLRATVVQRCVVTLTELINEVTESFRLLFGPIGAEDDDHASSPKHAREIDLSPDDEDDPEPIEGDSIDIGEAIAQQLSLALDPYPRISDGEEALGELEDSDLPEGPFSALRGLRRGKLS
jgi:uncharacterized metal-binding protein YceD (DUF177 family)